MTFSDGATLEVGAVISATGFTSDYSWIAASVLDKPGGVVHHEG